VSAAQGRVSSLDGPVLHVVSDEVFRINEAVLVGSRGLLGEVLRIQGRHFVVQVYEDTTGLRPGDRVTGTGQALSARLGPALLGGIFDGLLRPLAGTGQPWVLPGMRTGGGARFVFEPSLAEGAGVAGGEILGKVTGGTGKPQRCLIPPGLAGRLERLVPAGEYRDDEPLCAVAPPQGEPVAVTMSHAWPVRRPRPLARRLPASTPMLTGQRLIDSLFPVARGSSAAMPGGFGTGKTILQQSIAKWCDADVIVYVGCGERGNEMTEVLREFPELEDPRSGRPLSERSVIIANTSNMPVAAREASIYTGVTVAEYFRDQGLHVALMADSTSRWAEALREIGGRLGDLPAEAGYPAYLGTRQAEFYERAACGLTLSGEEGSVTLIGAVSPPGGDLSEPVTLHTQRNVRCFWPLDRERARARFYPAIDPLSAYAEDARVLDEWWRGQDDPEHEARRQRFLTLLEDESRLARMARIVGKNALPAGEQLTLLCARLVNEAFLRQSAFSEVDCYASPRRQIAMMAVLDHFVSAARLALQEGATIEAIEGRPVLRRLRRMGEEIGEDRLDGFDALRAEIDRAFAGLAAPAPGEEASEDEG